jgi:hypothetical protein
VAPCIYARHSRHIVPERSPFSSRYQFHSLLEMPNSFQLPDLTQICSEHFELRVNQHCSVVGKESLRWLEDLGFFVDDKAHEQFLAAQLPLLAALCYPTCDLTQLRVVTDCLTMLFYGFHHSQSVNDGARQIGLERYAVLRIPRTRDVVQPIGIVVHCNV